MHLPKGPSALTFSRYDHMNAAACPPTHERAARMEPSLVLGLEPLRLVLVQSETIVDAMLRR